jgi:16S rRNA (guanine527-N7)-methyltransferase
MVELPTSEKEISELLKPFLGPARLSSFQLRQVSIYLELLLRWNSKINLTSVRAPEEIVTRHFGESFFAASQILATAEPPASSIDVGSGAGFPGLPMKVFSPEIELTLVESNNKKVAFLREVVRALGLQGVSVLGSRAENLTIAADVVSLRAVERFERTLHITRKLLKPKGRLLLLIGLEQVEAAKSVLPELSWGKPVPIPLSKNRVLAIGCLA